MYSNLAMADISLLFTGFNCREFPATDGKTERRLQFYHDVCLSLFTHNISLIYRSSIVLT